MKRLPPGVVPAILVFSVITALSNIRIIILEYQSLGMSANLLERELGVVLWLLLPAIWLCARQKSARVAACAAFVAVFTVRLGVRLLFLTEPTVQHVVFAALQLLYLLPFQLLLMGIKDRDNMT